MLSQAGSGVVDNFLDSLTGPPAVLILEGDPGIGKTTRWLSIIDEAGARGVRTLSARPTEAESKLAFATLADLLRDLDDEVFDRLAPPQRVALDRVLQRSISDGAPTDPAATAAALLSIVERMARSSPLLLAIDDLQWVDRSSSHVLASTVRRLPVCASVLGAVRTGRPGGDPAAWLQPRVPEARRLAISPMTPHQIGKLVTDRLGRPLARSALEQVQKVSRGNPFFALELARSIDAHGWDHRQSLPNTLTDVVQARLGDASSEVRQALLAVASLADPTVELVQAALETTRDRTRELLEDAERRRVIEIDGHRLRFSHPLLANGIYTLADGLDRRAMHRRLADCVTDQEQHARHLALGSLHCDAATIRALDEAAAAARVRGAPAAAAELLEMALRLGADDPERRLLVARHLHDAGDAQHARAVLEASMSRLPPNSLRARTASTLAQVRLHDDSFVEAAALLESALAESETDAALQMEILTQLAYALVNAGASGEALARAEEAVAHGERLGPSDLLAQALGMRLMIRFMHGEGLDESALNRAVTLEDVGSRAPVAMRPSVHAALLHAWTGRLDQACEEIAAMRQTCIELGDENALTFVDFHGVLVHCWRGDFLEAERLSKDAERRSRELGGEVPHAISRSVSAMVSSFTGRVDETRQHAEEALASFRNAGMLRLSEWPVTTLGFLELSRGDHQAALRVLDPLLAWLEPDPKGTEIIAASFLPDAIEAMVSLGQLDQAEPLVAALESNGSRLDRAWLLAVGHRCRSMLEAAHGDLKAASLSAQAAMVEHDRLPMPFERARTQLLVGQIQRRLRQKESAAATLTEALATFEEVGTPLWAERCRAEIGRVGHGRTAGTMLTSSEQRVAELAATGMTNREVAAALFISPKTVESNLAKVYRKLDIRSRAELGSRMGQQK